MADINHITLTNRDLVLAGQGLRNIGPKAIKNIRAAFGIAVIKRVSSTALQDLEAARIALCEQWAAKDGEGGKPVKLPDGTFDIPDRAGFEVEFNKLLDLTVTLPNCTPIKLSDLEGTEGITPDDLFSLGPLLNADAVPA